MSVREQHYKRKKQDVRDAINVLRGDGGYDNLDCGILSLTRFRDEVRSLLIEGVGEVQDEFLPKIAAAAVAYLEDKLDRIKQNGRETQSPC